MLCTVVFGDLNNNIRTLSNIDNNSFNGLWKEIKIDISFIVIYNKRTMSLEERIARLEGIEEIRYLQAKYQ